MARIIEIGVSGITDDKRGYVPLCPDAMTQFWYMSKLPVERLKIRIEYLKELLSLYLMKLVIDNQEYLGKENGQNRRI